MLKNIINVLEKDQIFFKKISAPSKREQTEAVLTDLSKSTNIWLTFFFIIHQLKNGIMLPCCEHEPSSFQSRLVYNVPMWKLSTYFKNYTADLGPVLVDTYLCVFQKRNKKKFFQEHLCFWNKLVKHCCKLNLGQNLSNKYLYCNFFLRYISH